MEWVRRGSGKGDERERLEGQAPEASFRNSALENLKSFAVGFLWFGKNDLVYTKTGLVEDDFGFGIFCEVNCFVDEEVHQRDDTCVDECADTKCELEAQFLNDEAGNQLTSPH